MSARIMIVEDDPDTRLLIRIGLEGQGYAVVEAEGTEALDYVKLNPPDVIILDLKMPEVSGWAIMGQLKASPATANIPVVVVTGKEGHLARTAGKAMGAIDYIRKPFTDNQITSAVQRALVSETTTLKPEISRKYQVRWNDDSGKENLALFDSYRQAQALVAELRHEEEVSTVGVGLETA